MREGFITVGGDGLVRGLNRAAGRMLGRAPGDPVGLPLERVAPELARLAIGESAELHLGGAVYRVSVDNLAGEAGGRLLFLRPRSTTHREI